MCRQLLALALLCAPMPSSARGFGIEDMLRMESYGQVVTVDDRDLLLVERRRPYRSAPDFGYGGYFNDRTLGRVLAVRLSEPDVGLRPLFPQDDDAGYWMGSTSPSGRLLSVFRLRSRTLSLGVVDLLARSVRWLDVRPDLPSRSPAPVWVGEDRLLLVERLDGDLPRILSLGSAGSERSGRLYRSQSRGDPSVTFASTYGSAPPAPSTRLVEVAVDGSARRGILQGDVVDFAASPDGAAVAVVTAEGPVAPPDVPIGVSFRSRRLRMSMVSVRDGRVTATVDDVAPNVFAWSSTGRLLLIARGASDAGWSRARVVAVTPTGGRRALGRLGDVADAPDAGDALRFQATWVGSRALVRVRPADGPPSWRILEEGRSAPVAASSAATLSVHDGRDAVLAAGASRWLVDERGARLLPAGRAPLVTTALEPFSSAARDEAGPCGRVLVGNGGRDEERLCGRGIDPAPGDEVLAAHTRGLIVRRMDERGVQTLFALAPGGAARPIDVVNAHLAALVPPILRRLETRDPAGRRLVHWLLLPRTDAGTIPDLVVQPYPGRTYDDAPPSEATPGRQRFGVNVLLLVEAGFAVLLPSMPRTPGRNPVGDVVPQVAVAVQAARASDLVRAGPYGVMGHSFGGWAAMVLATGTDCLAGVVAANGVYDLAAAHATMVGPDRIDLPLGIPYGPSAGWAETGQGGMGAVPSRAADRYDAASPIMRPERASTEVLLAGGDLDPVDLEQTERMFMELGRAGRRATMMRFWGEGHTSSSPGNLRTYWSTAASFLREAAARARTAGTCAAVRPAAGGDAAARPGAQLQAAAQASQAATNMSDR
jgi:dipeptidyl aminopeptidase/acylaminoacyl peptidase